MPTEYEIPTYGTPTDKLHGWLMEANQQGMAWLGAQKQAATWASAVSMMEEQDLGLESALMSNTTYPKSKRIARELVASLASFRHEGETKTVWDNTLYDTAHLLTDLDRNWYLTALQRMGNPHRAWLQNGVIKGTGYVIQEWDKHFWGPNKGDIRLTSLDPSDVTFVQLPADRDIQRAYMVIVKYEMPINLAKRVYWKTNPGFANALVPDQESPSWIVKGLQKVQQFLSPALRVAGRTRQTANGSFPTVNIYHAFTMDNSINQGFMPIRMGPEGTNWSYTVPAIGDPIPTGMGTLTRPATDEDCRMFPLRRYTIFSNTGVCSDDTSPYWHGDVPVARVWFNDLPWNALGGSLISDGRTMEGGISALMRGMEDAAAARLDPPALFDDSLVSASWAKAFNPRMAGTRGAAPLAQGNPITYPVDPRTYDVAAWIPQFMEAQEQRMNYLAALPDMTAIAKAKQIPGADTQEKLFEMAGPIVQDLVRALEEPLTQLGDWRRSLYFQFYNAARVINTVGPDQFDPNAWNYGPERLKEIQTHQSYQFKPEMLMAVTTGQTPSQRNEGLRRLMSEFRYEVTESGINELHRMTTKLFYLQLMKEGFPISWWTFARIAKIPNFGPPPEGTNTELERYVAQQHIKIELQADLQKELALAQMEMGDGQVGPGAAGGEPQEIPDIGGEGQRGRPQSYRKPPRLVQKDNQTRTTVTTA